jgi:hypothetical protein
VTQDHRSAAPFRSPAVVRRPPPASTVPASLPVPDPNHAHHHITSYQAPLLPFPCARAGPEVSIFPSPRFRCHRALPSPPIPVAPSRLIPRVLPPPPSHPYLAFPFACIGGCLPSSDCVGSPPLFIAPLIATSRQAFPLPLGCGM